MTLKVKGTNEGFKTEALIENYLNGKKITKLKASKIKDFIYYICNENNIKIDQETIITVKNIDKKKFKINGSPKTDKVFKISKKEFNISIKSGQGGSFHQEPEGTFLKFLKIETEIDDEKVLFLKNFLRNENINIKNSILAKFFNEKRLILINRVFSGRFNEPDVDYYFFCPKIKKEDSKEIKINKIEKGKYLKKSSLIKLVNNNVSKGACTVGLLTFQAYNRKRGTDIQFKWGTCYHDIK